MQRIDHIPVWGSPVNVAAHRDKVSVSAVGFDIACGNKAILTDADAGEVRRNIAAVMADVFRVIGFGGRRKNGEKAGHGLFDKYAHDAWTIRAVAALKPKAVRQLGTVGAGNHYAGIFIDERERVWIAVHFGSREFGHGIAAHFMQRGGWGLLDADSPMGQDYLSAMELAGMYAYAGRDWVCARVARILGANVVEEVHNHHNFAWREAHGGEVLWVVRKGAAPAYPGQRGFIGGPMGGLAAIVEGVDTRQASESFYPAGIRVVHRLETIGVATASAIECASR